MTRCCTRSIWTAPRTSARRSLSQAASAQRAAYHADAALRLAERGLEIARADADRHALICLIGELQRDLGDIAASIATYRMALAAAPDEPALLPSAARACRRAARQRRAGRGAGAAGDAQRLAERHEMVPELAHLHHLRGNIFFPLGRIDGCRDEHERGLGFARRSGSPEAEARALGGLADAAYAQGRMRSAFEHFSRCVALSQQHGFGRIEVANRSMVGFSRIYLNEVPASERGRRCCCPHRGAGRPAARRAAGRDDGRVRLL